MMCAVTERNIFACIFTPYEKRIGAIKHGWVTIGARKEQDDRLPPTHVCPVRKNQIAIGRSRSVLNGSDESQCLVDEIRYEFVIRCNL